MFKLEEPEMEETEMEMEEVMEEVPAVVSKYLPVRFWH